MTILDARSPLDGAAARWPLLEHPYYQQWQAGSLTTQDLAAYAGQYRHIERCLPAVLEAAVAMLADGPVKQLVADTLADELTTPRAHVDLFEEFAAAVGATEAPATPATQAVVDTYLRAAAAGPEAVLAAVGAYEVQAAEIALTKAQSLRDHYGLDAAATEFWDVHAGLETDHASWTGDALSLLGAPADTVTRYAEESALAWWRFLDERAA